MCQLQLIKRLALSTCCAVIASGCTTDDDVNGVYANFENGSEPVRMTLSRTGDGIISGTYEGHPQISATVAGHTGLLSHSIKIDVPIGKCAGMFEGTFVLKEFNLKGHLVNLDNRNCEITLNLHKVR